MAPSTDVNVGIDVAKAQVDVAVQPTRHLDGSALARQPAPLAGLAGGPAADPHRAGSDRRLRAGRGGGLGPRLRSRPRHPGQDRSAVPAGWRASRRRCGPHGAPNPRRWSGGGRPLAAAGTSWSRRASPSSSSAATEPRGAGRQRRTPLAASVTRLIQQADRDLAALVQAEPTLRPRATWLQRIPGIGPVTAATLLARTRALLPPAGRRPGRGRPLQPRQPRLARAPAHLGWPRPGPRFYMATLTAVRSAASAPATSACARPASQRPHRLPAQAPGPLQRPLQWDRPNP